jgi:hypothetical protein
MLLFIEDELPSLMLGTITRGFDNGEKSLSMNESEYRLRSLIYQWHHLSQKQRAHVVGGNIPMYLLPEFWFRVTGADEMFIMDVFAKLCLTPGDREMNHRISNDVPRTLQSEEAMRDAVVQSRLSSVLQAYAIFDPRVGYCQVTDELIIF